MQQAQTPPQPYNYQSPPAELLQQQMQRAQELAQQTSGFQKEGDGFRWFGPPGPSGDDNWKNAYPGFQSQRGFFFAPPWPGAFENGYTNFLERPSHFFNLGGKKFSVNCGGEDCGICEAYQLALDAGDKNAFGKQRKQIIYQGFPLEMQMQGGQYQFFANVNALMHSDGVLRPMLFQAPITIHNKLNTLIPLKTFDGLFHPDTGKPFVVTKKKTGPENVNVDWDMIELDPMPLPQEYRPGLQHLYKLHEIQLFQPATVEEQKKTIMQAGLPMPAKFGGNGQTFGPPQGGFQQPTQQPMPQGYGQPMPQGFQAPQGQPMPMPMPQPTQQAMSYQQGANPPYPNPYQAPQQAPQQAQGYYQPQQGQPMPMPQGSFQAPPPLPQPTNFAGQGYAPVAGGPPPPMRTPAPAGGPPPPQMNPPPQQPVQKYTVQEGTQLVGSQKNSGVALPDGRENCFTNYNGADKFCQECPAWIQSQCIPQSAQAAPSEDQQLSALPIVQQQLPQQPGQPQPQQPAEQAAPQNPEQLMAQLQQQQTGGTGGGQENQ